MSKCVITVYEPNSTELYNQEKYAYLYSETTSVFPCEYDGFKIKGQIEVLILHPRNSATINF